MKEYTGTHTCIRNIELADGYNVGRFEESKIYKRRIDAHGKTYMTAEDGVEYPIAPELYEEHFLFESEEELSAAQNKN